MELRPIDLPTALLVAVAALCCSVVLGCAFVLLAGVLPGSGDAAAWWAAAGLACASVATLIALTRSAGGLRPGALAVAWLLAFVWPLSGFPFAAALIATAATGLAAAWGGGGRAGTRAAAVRAVVALELMTVAFAAAPDEAAPYRPRAAAAASSSPPDRPSSPAPDRLPADSAMHRRASPARVVRAYYGALDRRDFGRAWRSLSPAVRASFGGFEQWRAGFGATLASVPSGLRVTTAGGEATVDHVLTARDRAACGVLIQQFSVRWGLTRTVDGWRAAELSAGQRPGARCLTS